MSLEYVKMRGVRSTDGTSCVWGGSYESVLEYVDRSANNGAVGQLFARWGLSGVLYGPGGVGGKVASGGLSGRLLADGFSGNGANGTGDVSRADFVVESSEVGGVGLPLFGGGLRDVGGAEGVDDSLASDGVFGGQRGGVDAEHVVTDGEAGMGRFVGAEQFGASVETGAGAAVRSDGGVAVRGRNYARNKAKRERAKAGREGVRALNEVCPSLSGSVKTVDTRTADEIEAANSLARRRAAENEVAIALAKHKLASLQDKDKTESLGRLAAARIEERINTAKAKSQASFKKCDESLKSLGSTGSAGEFALKKEVEKGAAWEVKYKYLEEQLKLAFPYIPDDIKQRICELPEPEFPNVHEIFGDCPSDYDDDEREAYYIELDRMNADAVCA